MPGGKKPQPPKKGGFSASVAGKLLGRKDIPETAQQSIPYREMHRDGTCRVTDRLYTKTVAYQDVNYQLAQNEDKTAIFEGWCDFLNYFDSSVHVQLSFINQDTDFKELEKAIEIPARNDEFNDIREEYCTMLRSQLAKGNNGLTKLKYITFGVDADNLRDAKPRLERIETDVLNNFKALGVSASALNGHDRLALLHGMFNGSDEKFRFSWNMLPQTGMSTKDFIAPSSFDFRGKTAFRVGKKHGAVSFLQILAPELTDTLLADFLDMESNVIVNLHIQSIDQTEAIKTVKRKLSDLDKMKIEEQKKAVRSGYDMDIIPTDLATYGSEAKTLLEDLQSRNERMFLVTVLVVNLADTKQKLENNVFQAAGIAQKHNCALKRLDFQQEPGFMSSLPLGLNQIEIQRGLTTSSTAIFVPFTTQELFQRNTEALYYGLNALSKNMIMLSRKELKSPNALILGTPGSGKSFTAKREIVNVFLLTDDEILLCDVEAEYLNLTRQLHGIVIELSPTSKTFVNPLDIDLTETEDNKDPIATKSDFLISWIGLLAADQGQKELSPIEKTLIDRCSRIVYEEYMKNPVPERMPILGNIWDLLNRQDEKEAQHLATKLEMYVNGSLHFFNHRTNIEGLGESRVVCFNVKGLGTSLRLPGMMTVQEFCSNRVSQNFQRQMYTRYYCDEFHVMLRDQLTTSYAVDSYKRFRKRGCAPTLMTQNVKILLQSSEIEDILDNSDMIIMLNQAPGDRVKLAQRLNISSYQLSFITNSGAGEGLIFYGNTIIPFIDKFPQDTRLYKIMTTKPDEVLL